MKEDYLEMAKEAAYKEAVDDVDFKYLGRLSKKAIKRRFKYLNDLFMRLKEAMSYRTHNKEVAVCKACSKQILKPKDGFIIQGNVYVADIFTRRGLIGNNFPDNDSFGVGEVGEVIFCMDCLQVVLGIENKFSKQAKLRPPLDESVKIV